MARLIQIDCSPKTPASSTQSSYHSGSGRPIALHAPNQVNHCFQSWGVPDEKHPDAAALAVAAELLTNCFLHEAIRERGGAYGGGASYAATAGLFTMYSYRDPRMAGTYQDFAAAREAFLVTDFTTEQIEEAIISVIKKLDKPLSPVDALQTAIRNDLRGICLESRQQFRDGVLECTLGAIRAAVTHWLSPLNTQQAAFVGSLGVAMADFEVKELLAMPTVTSDGLFETLEKTPA